MIRKLALHLKRFQTHIEWVLMVIFIIGIVFKTSDIGTLLKVLSLSTLGTFYFILSFAVEDQQSKFVSVLNKVIYTSFTIGMLAILFTIQHYPNAKDLVLVAITTMIFGLMAKIILQIRNKDKQNIVDADLIRGVVISCIVVAFMIISPSKDHTSTHDQIKQNSPTERSVED